MRSQLHNAEDSNLCSLASIASVLDHSTNVVNTGLLEVVAERSGVLCPLRKQKLVVVMHNIILRYRKFPFPFLAKLLVHVVLTQPLREFAYFVKVFAYDDDGHLVEVVNNRLAKHPKPLQHQLGVKALQVYVFGFFQGNVFPL